LRIDSKEFEEADKIGIVLLVENNEPCINPVVSRFSGYINGVYMSTCFICSFKEGDIMIVFEKVSTS
jgi:hypothetical protein